MTPADWRALLEAYLDGRLSAEAFMRRFLEAWRVGAARPRAIIELQVAVEAFEADVLRAGEEGAINDDDLRQATLRAKENLHDEEVGYPPGAHTFDRVRAREEMRRFQVSAQRVVGVGCLIALVWVALCLLQITFVSEWIQHTFGWSAWPSAFVGFFLAFVPVVGNVLAFLDATEIRDWPLWLAALVFFAAPALTILSGWSRWRRQR
jgi:hypothetical protein